MLDVLLEVEDVVLVAEVVSDELSESSDPHAVSETDRAAAAMRAPSLVRLRILFS